MYENIKQTLKTKNLSKSAFMKINIKKQIGKMYLPVKKKNFFIYEIAFFLSGSIGSIYLFNKIPNKTIDIDNTVVNTLSDIWYDLLCYFIIVYNLIYIIKILFGKYFNSEIKANVFGHEKLRF